MSMFHKKSTWEKLVAPVKGQSKVAARSGLTAVGTLVGVSLASAAVSALRQRRAGQ
jgi:hypothetical protein